MRPPMHADGRWAHVRYRERAEALGLATTLRPSGGSGGSTQSRSPPKAKVGARFHPATPRRRHGSGPAAGKRGRPSEMRGRSADPQGMALPRPLRGSGSASQHVPTPCLRRGIPDGQVASRRRSTEALRRYQVPRSAWHLGHPGAHRSGTLPSHGRGVSPQAAGISAVRREADGTVLANSASWGATKDGSIADALRALDALPGMRRSRQPARSAHRIGRRVVDPAGNDPGESPLQGDRE